MNEMMSESINDMPFKLRFTSTQKLTKEIEKMISERYEMMDKLEEEYDTIGQHKHILGNIREEIQTCYESLKKLRALCQCQSDDDKNAVNKQLATSEELLAKLNTKCDTIQMVRMVDVGVKRLPSNWRAAMLRIAKDKAKKAFNESISTLTDANDNKDSNEPNGDNNGSKNSDSLQNNDIKTEETNEGIDENIISSEAAEINHQFEMDLERKIYETQVEELMQLIQSFVMRIKTLRARIDISKQLIKVVLKIKREYESCNSKLKESMATCHCVEAGADDDQEFQKRMEEKRTLEEIVERTSAGLKYWEEQYAILKEGRNKANENEVKVETSANNINTPTTTVVEVANEEEVPNEYIPIASTSSQQSCMFAGQTHNSNIAQGTANPAVIYLEGLVAHQQPTYIPASNLHQPIGVYPHSYPLGHHPYHQAPDGSIQVYSSDISPHPSYIAYQ